MAIGNYSHSLIALTKEWLFQTAIHLTLKTFIDGLHLINSLITNSIDRF
jgi:hypothetical protein